MISVVCPTFNSASFVLETLRSLVRQTDLPDEVVISDDGSTDDTVRVATQFLEQSSMRARVLKNPHRGPGAARNAGVKTAAGDWIAFLDSDDLWLPTKIAAVRRAIESNPSTNLICHAKIWRRLDGTEEVVDFGAMYKPDQSLIKQLFRNLLFHTSAVTCRKETLIQAGLFDETLMSGQDTELWFRMSPLLKVHFIREPQGYYVERRGNITSGSMERRLVDTVRLNWRHRRKVGSRVFAWTILRVLCSYAKRKTIAFCGPSMQ